MMEVSHRDEVRGVVLEKEDGNILRRMGDGNIFPQIVKVKLRQIYYVDPKGNFSS